MDKKEEILKAFNFRFACKSFDTEKKISDEDFAFILETGRLSPSSFGWEPWQFVVVQNMELREKLETVAWGAKGQLPTASHFMVLLTRKAVDTKASSDYIKYIASDIQELPADIVSMKTGFYDNFIKNDFDLTSNRKLFDWASRQTYISLANMMSSAAQIGIDSCPIEGFNKEKTEALLEQEGIIDSKEFGVSVMAAFGYRASDVHMHAKTRQPIDKVVKWVM